MKMFVDVPFEEKEEAKSNGVKWDKLEKNGL